MAPASRRIERRSSARASASWASSRTISLDYDRAEPGAPRSLIAKFPAAAQENREVAMFFRFYEREVGFYQHIGGKVELRTPRCYFNAFDPSNGDFVLLLEDLAPAVVGDQVAGCTVEHVNLAIRELAKFQATWWRSPELDKLDWMPGINAEWNVAAVEQSYPPSWDAVRRVHGRLPDAGAARRRGAVRAAAPQADEPLRRRAADDDRARRLPARQHVLRRAAGRAGVRRDRLADLVARRRRLRCRVLRRRQPDARKSAARASERS